MIFLDCKLNLCYTTEKNKFIEAITSDPDVADAGCIILYSSQTGEGREDLWEELYSYTKLNG